MEVIPRENKYQNVKIMGLKKKQIFAEEDLFKLIDQGNLLWITSATGKNE